MHEHARACSRVLTIFRRPICFDCLNRARSSRSGCSRPDFFPLAPLAHPVLRPVIFSLVLPLLSLSFRLHRPHPSMPLHRSSPPFLSSPSLLRNVHQLFLSFHISSPFIFFVCKPGIPDRRECSRLYNGGWTHGSRGERATRGGETRERLGKVGIRASKTRISESSMQRGYSYVNLYIPYVDCALIIRLNFFSKIKSRILDFSKTIFGSKNCAK